ncbi:ABC transporter substrate-binding protein [Lachnobacterium bovis]|uniref:Arabinosaccharide transport system substrate-binding protein n=1 Tax=Lachnobacterium bovis TaxID=140626 RepID=A0A1H9T908_9FIRM|nr:ABC transporter substrate-binding protein [Lachnobacterium bovis]SER93702.1 arabinosaccharide transport system substrate-binding protein [Lachnobacterium bovis]
MNKKFLSTLLCTTMVASSLFGCGTNTASNKASAKDKKEEPVVTSFGDKKGTKLELWTFVGQHADFYGKMVEKWNEKNPDRTINMKTTTYPFSDMHTKLTMTLQSKKGAPDICDVEAGQYPNVVKGQDEWLYPLDEAIKPYKDTMVESRLDMYKGQNGKQYGAPFHIGATVMYYNMEQLEKYGITQADVDSVKTWDDYEKLGKRYVEARGEKGKFFTSVDTAGTDWLTIAMAEYGEDWTGGNKKNAKPNVKLKSVNKMLEYQQKLLKEKVAQVSTDGQVDTDGGIADIGNNTIVSFPKALWFMSRFKDKLGADSGKDQTGKWYIAKCPVFEEGQKCSVGIGGTGTVVTKQSKAKKLAADFICFAKMSEDGEKMIWNDLGFDVCNTALWDECNTDQDNFYNKYFRNKPYEVLKQIKDDIGKVSITKNTPAINDQINSTTLNDVLEKGKNVKEALEEAQSTIESDSE